jgi:ORF6N domain
MAKRSSKTKRALVTIEPLEPVIRTIRGQRVILDSDLAKTYGVTTARLNQQVNRNLAKFPSDFMFRLTRDEFNSLMLQFATSKPGRGGARKLPYAFTEHGAIMAANVLNSERAVAMSVYVVRAFVKLREVLAGTKELAKKLDDLERKLTGRLDTHEKAIIEIFARIRKLLQPPPPQTEPKRRRIGF